jgi:membrane protein YdbS with pleckstrin-like domain
VPWAALLLLSRVGAASIEVARDSAFFKHVDSRDLSVIAVLWTAMPLAYLISPIVFTLLNWSLGSPAAVFAVLGTVLLLFGAVVHSRVPHTK